MVFKRNVADDTEADEWRAVYIARLGDRAALHVDRLGIGKVIEYRLHLLA